MIPFNDRYKHLVIDIESIYGENNYLKTIYEIEKKFLINYCLCYGINPNIIESLESLDYDYDKIKEIELKTKHDIVAVTEYIKYQISNIIFVDTVELRNWLCNHIHFGLTSQDLVSLSNSILCKKAMKIVVDDTNNFHNRLLKFNSIKFIGYTHGQKAVPTNLTHIISVVMARTTFNNIIHKSRFGGGTIGNGYSINKIYENDDSIIIFTDICNKTINNFDIIPLDLYRQSDYYPSIVESLREIERVSLVLENFCVDMWGYISKDLFIQNNNMSESGSSTMSQKVNPISFENAEGNFMLARNMANIIANKISVSRYDRDLSDITVIRNISLVFGYYSVAIKSLIKGIDSIEPNKHKIDEILSNSYEMLAESVNLFLRHNNNESSYDISKKMFKGKKNLTKQQFDSIIDLEFDKQELGSQIKKFKI